MSDILPPPSPPPLTPTAPGPPSSTATTVLVLGILSIVLAGFPIAGLVLGIIGMKKARVAAEELRTGRAPASSAGMVTAGRVCSIVGTCLASAMHILWCVYITCVGAAIMGSTMSKTHAPPSAYRAP